MNKLLAIIGAASLALSAQAQQNEVELTLLETSDVHGNYLPYDFINGEAGAGSLARVMTYTDKLRKETGRDHVILLETAISCKVSLRLITTISLTRRQRTCVPTS